MSVMNSAWRAAAKMGSFPLHPLIPRTAQCPGAGIPSDSGTPKYHIFNTKEIQHLTGSFKFLTEDMNPKLLFSCLVFLFPSADNSGLRVTFTTVTKLCLWPHTLVLPYRLGSLPRLHLLPISAGPCRSQWISPSKLRIAIVFIFHNYDKEGPNQRDLPSIFTNNNIVLNTVNLITQ